MGLVRRAAVESHHVLGVRRRNSAKRPSFWGIRLQPGRRAVVKIPAGFELRVTQACPVPGDECASHVAALCFAGGMSLGDSSAVRFSVGPHGVRLPMRLHGDPVRLWLEADEGQPLLKEVHLSGFLCESEPVEASCDAPNACIARPVASKGSSVPALTVDAVTTPAPPPARYNPLRPVAASVATAMPVRAKVPEAERRLPQVKLQSVPGLTYEEQAIGEGAAAAKQGQLCVLKLAIRAASDKKMKVVERGEVKVRIGQAEVVDGWVDGNVDIEEVLAKWSQCAVGMRVGGKRRLHASGKLGFRECGGEALAKGSGAICDFELKQLL